MKLLLSRDAGMYYDQVHDGEMSELLKFGKQYDEEMLRWVIVDGDKVVENCAIHIKTIIATAKAGAMMVTLDKYLIRLSNESSNLVAMGLEAFEQWKERSNKQDE